MKTKYKHLNCEERTLIQLSLERGCTTNAIVLSLDRSVSYISCELARNGWCDPKSQSARAGRPALAGGYRAVTAHQRTALNRSRGRNPFAWLLMAICGLKFKSCLGSDTLQNRLRAYFHACSQMIPRCVPVTKPFIRRSTRCRAVSCVPSCLPP